MSKTPAREISAEEYHDISRGHTLGLMANQVINRNSDPHEQLQRIAGYVPDYFREATHTYLLGLARRIAGLMADDQELKERSQ